MKAEDKCQIPKCRNEAGIIYLGKGVCLICWHKYVDLEEDADMLKKKLGLTIKEGAQWKEPF